MDFVLFVRTLFLSYYDFFDKDWKVRRETELLDPSDPDCMVKKESLEWLELRLLLGEKT